MKAILETNKGNIGIKLLDILTPVTVNNFVKLSKEGFYEGVKFHRVVSNFMIQGGDPLTKDDTRKHLWGTGGPGYKFQDEITSENNNCRGSISMANAGRNTNGSQFFINLRDNHYLNPNHTVFGHVVEGMEVVDAIGCANTNSLDQPLEDFIIYRIIV